MFCTHEECFPFPRNPGERLMGLIFSPQMHLQQKETCRCTWKKIMWGQDVRKVSKDQALQRAGILVSVIWFRSGVYSEMHSLSLYASKGYGEASSGSTSDCQAPQQTNWDKATLSQLPVRTMVKVGMVCALHAWTEETGPLLGGFVFRGYIWILLGLFICVCISPSA